MTAEATAQDRAPSLAPGAVSRRYAAWIVGLMVGVALLDAILMGAGLLESGAWRYLGVACLLGAGSIVAWEPVARRGRGSRLVDAISWASFPAAALFLAASVPFFSLAVYPPLEGLLFPPRVEAIVPFETIEVVFPREVRPATPNVGFEGCVLTAEFMAEEKGAFEWPDRMRLRIHAGRLARKLGIAWPRELLLNQSDRVPLLQYASSGEVPPLRVRIP